MSLRYGPLCSGPLHCMLTTRAHDCGREKTGCGKKKMTSDKRYFETRASEEAMRAAQAESEEARQWHRDLADKFSRLASEVEDNGFGRFAQSPAPERRAAQG